MEDDVIDCVLLQCYQPPHDRNEPYFGHQSVKSNGYERCKWLILRNG